MSKNNLFSSYDLNEETENISEEEEMEEVEGVEVDLDGIEDPYERFLEQSEEILVKMKKGEVGQFMTFEKGMHPTCKYNKSVLNIVNSKIIKKGDIVLLSNGIGYSIKRVIKVSPKGTILLGDNERRYTLVLDRESIVGKIVSKVEKTKYTSFNSHKERRKAHGKYVRFAWLRTLGRIENRVISTQNTFTKVEEPLDTFILSSIDDLPPIE